MPKQKEEKENNYLNILMNILMSVVTDVTGVTAHVKFEMPGTHLSLHPGM